MTDDLVKRLRVPDPCCEEHHTQNEAADRIERLERERVLDAKLLADTQALLDTALEAVIDAKLVGEAKVQALEAERDAAIAALPAVSAPVDAPAEDAMSDLIDRTAVFLVLRKAQIASCTCQIKTPDPDWHNHNCRYRILREIEAMIEHLPDAAALAAIRESRT